MLTQERVVLTEHERAQPLDVAPALGARPSAATGCHRLRPLGSIDAHPRGPIREGRHTCWTKSRANATITSLMESVATRH
jgi:hypothetical protein